MFNIVWNELGLICNTRKLAQLVHSLDQHYKFHLESQHTPLGLDCRATADVLHIIHAFQTEKAVKVPGRKRIGGCCVDYKIPSKCN